MKRTFLGLATFSLVVACATSPLGRKQFLLVPDSQMNAMGVSAFQEMKAQQPTISDPSLVQYVNCIVKPLTVAARGQTPVNEWEVVIFNDDTPNAFALPGGKIGVHTGILKVAKTDAQLAAVLGHELGHVIARHGAERVSTQLAAAGGLGLIDAFLNRKNSSGGNQFIMAALGLGVQFGVALPHSRTQESEADIVGEDLMADAGFDPAQSMELWKNMLAVEGTGRPPEWLSTHPAGQNRIASLQGHLAEAQARYARSVKISCRR